MFGRPFRICATKHDSFRSNLLPADALCETNQCCRGGSQWTIWQTQSAPKRVLCHVQPLQQVRSQRRLLSSRQLQLRRRHGALAVCATIDSTRPRTVQPPAASTLKVGPARRRSGGWRRARLSGMKAHACMSFGRVVVLRSVMHQVAVRRSTVHTTSLKTLLAGCLGCSVNVQQCC